MTSGCLTSSGWYLGLDGNPTSGKIDFVAVVMHELGHGLGFQSWVDESTGQRTSNFDDVFMKFLEDHSTGKMWTAMTDAERKASAINSGNLHWTGSNVLAAATGYLSAGMSGGHVRMYAPNPIDIAVGQSVTWTNNDSTAHTSTGNDGSWNSGAIAPGASFSQMFPNAGTFAYHCAIHPGMVGTVAVR